MNSLSGQPNTSYRLDIVKELYIRYCMRFQYISHYHMIISYCKTSYYCILPMNKSRLEKPSILQEAVFIFVSPAPSTASLRGTHGTSVSEKWRCGWFWSARSFVYFVIYTPVHCCCCFSIQVLSDSLWPQELMPARLLCPGDFPGKNSGVCCCFLPQGIFLTQGLNSGLLHCSQILYPCPIWEAHTGTYTRTFEFIWF